MQYSYKELQHMQTQPPSVSRSLNSSCPATTLLPSSTNSSSITPPPGDGTGIEVYNSVGNLHTFTNICVRQYRHM